jgi:hypothetical protein
MTYSIEQYKADKAAVDAAKAELSCLVVGEGTGRCSLYSGEYARISTYFGRKDNVDGITHYGDTVRRVARMFVVITSAHRIGGFDCNVYDALLKEVEKKIKSMRVFKRKPKIKCFQPKLHTQPCYCARLRAVEAAAAIAVAPIEPDLKEELQAKVNGALILDKEFIEDDSRLA